jgi:hypothetical protein
MPYSNAVFYLDPDLGNDAARTALTTVTVSNPSGTITRCNKPGHGLVTGAVVDLSLFSSWLNFAWKITVVDADNFDLDGAVWQVTADNNGTATPRGGSSMADAWKTVNVGVTAARHTDGDIIRIKASPDPTAMGQNATWTDGPFGATRPILSSTNTSPITISLLSANYTSLAPAVGDTVVINGHGTNTNANGIWTVSAVNGSNAITLQTEQGTNSTGNGVGGSTGTVRKINNCVVRLAAPVTKNIALIGNQGQKPNWSASANVTNTVIQSDFKEGGECQQVAIALAFTTGLAAFFPTGTLDLSGYQQVAFWIKQTAGTLGAAGAVSLKLCTDTAGVTGVHTLNVPALATLNQWSQVVVDLGANMSAAIKSVALYVNTDNGAQTFLLDNIIACKASGSADSLTLASLISKNTGTEAWWGIQSINDTRIMLEYIANAIPASSSLQRGYAGVTETVPLYKRETTKPPMQIGGGIFMTPNKGGSSASNYISYSGGWNRTDMSTQTGETWFDGQNGSGTGMTDNGNVRSYLNFDKINFVRFSIGFTNSAGSSFAQHIGSLSAIHNSGTNIQLSGWQTTADNLAAHNAPNNISIGSGSTITTISRADSTPGNGVNLGAGSSIGTVVQANNNQSAGVAAASMTTIGTISAANGNQSGLTTGDGGTVGFVNANNNTVAGVNLQSSGGVKILGGTTSGNGAGVTALNSGLSVLRNFTASDTTPFAATSTFNNSTIFCERVNGVADTHLITTDGGTIISATDQRKTASGIAWKFRPASTNRNSAYPLSLSVAKVAVAANTSLSVQINTRRDNVNIKGRLRIAGGQLAGVPSDVTVACEPTINTWALSSALTVTPTETGVLEVFFDCWDGVGATNNFWIDDLVIA